MQPHYSTPIPPPQPPQKPRSRMWILWTSLGIFLAGLVVLFVIAMVKVKHKLDDTVKPMVEKAQSIMDSLTNTDNSHLYAELDSLAGEDSVSLALLEKLDSIRSATNEICAAFEKSKSEFYDTLHLAHARGSNKEISHEYYITTGRAAGLHRMLKAYEKQVLSLLPPEKRDTMLFQLDPLENVQQIKAPAFLKKMMNWETMYFDQPCQTVMSNFAGLRMNIRLNEAQLIGVYREELKEQQALRAADTIR